MSKIPARLPQHNTEKRPSWFSARVETGEREVFEQGALYCPECHSPHLWKGDVSREHLPESVWNNAVIIDFRCEDCGLEPELIIYESHGRTRLQWFNR